MTFWVGAPKVSHHLTMFGGHRHYDSGDGWALVCHVILQDHVIKVSYDFRVRSPSSYITILPSLVTISTMVVEICF